MAGVGEVNLKTKRFGYGLKSLEKYHVTVYRPALMSTVTLVTDGKDVGKAEKEGIKWAS